MSAGGASNFDAPRMDDTAQRLLYKLASDIHRLPIGGGGSGSCGAQSGAGAPTSTPDFVGQLYHDTVADAYWRSTGLTVADWTQIVGASNGMIWAPNATILNSIDFGGGWPFDVDVTTLTFPSLISVSGFIQMPGPVGLAILSFPVLTNLGGTFPFDFSSGSDLTTVYLPNVVTIAGNINGGNCATLTSFFAPLWVPTDGTNINISQCALDSSSVELILRRCVLAGVTTCTINLGGGTNAGVASLSAQGQADVVTLGVQLTINP